MIQSLTKLNIVDNTGVKTVKCIEILGKKKTGGPGDMFVGAISSLRPGGDHSLKKGHIVRGIILRTSKEHAFNTNGNTGIQLKSPENSAILIKQIKQGTSAKGEKEPLGTRIMGPVSSDLRRKGYLKLVSLCRSLV